MEIMMPPHLLISLHRWCQLILSVWLDEDGLVSDLVAEWQAFFAWIECQSGPSLHSTIRQITRSGWSSPVAAPCVTSSEHGLLTQITRRLCGTARSLLVTSSSIRSTGLTTWTHDCHLDLPERDNRFMIRNTQIDQANKSHWFILSSWLWDRTLLRIYAHM